MKPAILVILSAVLAVTGPAAAPAFAMDRPPPAPTDPASCGGYVGMQCPADQWCDQKLCGGAGRCRPRPEVCTREYRPVCGCDGRTYGNACEAQRAGTDFAHYGACRSGG